MATTASMIIRDANIRTQNPAQPRAEAVAFDGDTIIAVGSLASVLEFRGAATEVVDAAGRTLTPGLIDGHIHPLMGAAATRGGGLRRDHHHAGIPRAVAHRSRSHPP